MITSKNNSRVKEIRLLRQAKYRETRQEFLAEGIRLIEEALREPGLIRKIVYSPRLEKNSRGATLLSQLRQKVASAEWLYVSDGVLEKISDTQNHQGILAVLQVREWGWNELLQREGILLLLFKIQDPGNLGTIFRVAEAGGAAGLILSSATTDPYSPKVVRASMGSIFRLPFLWNQDIEECIKNLRSRGYNLWASTALGQINLWEVDLSQPTAVLFGQEGAGLPENLLKVVKKTLAIPMKPEVESLNVAMAAGLVIYEAFRQRYKSQPPKG